MMTMVEEDVPDYYAFQKLLEAATMVGLIASTTWVLAVVAAGVFAVFCFATLARTLRCCPVATEGSPRVPRLQTDLSASLTLRSVRSTVAQAEHSSLSTAASLLF